MPKKTRTPEQKLAREIQAATGRKYMDCLREARARLANPQGAK
jgi:hypothetical protein